jgi:kynurenine 3-monooxygenase
MRGRAVHALSGDVAFQPYGKGPRDAINSVSRGGLNVTLLEAAAAHPSVTLHFDRRCTDVDLDAPAATFEDGAGRTVTARADVVIGADGAYSAVRARLQRTDRFDFSQEYLEHGYKELTIPPGRDGTFALEPNALHIWPRGGFMMIALPNRDRTFTCTCFWPYDGPNGFSRLVTADDVLAYFRATFPDAVPLMPALAEEYRHNPVSSLVTVRCNPWHHDGRVLLLGDAAHAIVPFFGQGMNAAFEDCATLDDALERHGPEWATVLPAFTEARRPQADAIADLAVGNFFEMRDHVASRTFRARKRAEQMLHRWLSPWYMPLYNMSTFSNIPYAEARRRAAVQSRVIRLAATVGGLALVACAALLILWLA